MKNRIKGLKALIIFEIIILILNIVNLFIRNQLLIAFILGSNLAVFYVLMIHKFLERR